MKRNSFLKYLGLSPLIFTVGCAPGENIQTEPTPDRKRRIWKPEDIKAGIYITRNYQNNNIGMLCTITFQIGYNMVLGHQSLGKLAYDGPERTSVILIDRSSKKINATYTMNSIADGWCHGDVDLLVKENPFMGYTKETLCNELNNDQFGYRPTSEYEMHMVIKHLKKNFL